MNLDFEKDVEVDSDELDVEWKRHPQVSLKYGKYVVGLRNKYERLKLRRDDIKADLTIRIQNDPKSLIGKEKPTIKDIDAFIVNSDEHKEVENEILDCHEELGYAEVARRALEDKKSALENLVKLHGQDYFSVPRAVGISSEKVEEMSDERHNEKVKKRLKRTRTRNGNGDSA